MPKTINEIIQNPDWELIKNNPQAFKLQVIETIQRNLNQLNGEVFNQAMQVLQDYNLIIQLKIINEFQQKLKVTLIQMENKYFQTNHQTKNIQQLKPAFNQALKTIFEKLIKDVNTNLQNKIKKQIDIDHIVEQLPIQKCNYTINQGPNAVVNFVIDDVSIKAFSNAFIQTTGMAFQLQPFDMLLINEKKQKNVFKHLKSIAEDVPVINDWTITWVKYRRFIAHLKWLLIKDYRKNCFNIPHQDWLDILKNQTSYKAQTQINWLINQFKKEDLTCPKN